MDKLCYSKIWVHLHNYENKQILNTSRENGVLICLDSRQSAFGLFFLDSYGLYLHILKNIGMYSEEQSEDRSHPDFFKTNAVKLCLK